MVAIHLILSFAGTLIDSSLFESSSDGCVPLPMQT